MAGGITVSDVTAPDEGAYALLAQVHRRAFGPQGDSVWQAGAFRQLLESPGMYAHLFEIDDQPFGFCLYRLVVDEAELISVAVDPAFQKQGLASHIMSHLMAALKHLGAKQFFLEVRADNMSAISLYKRAGMTESGVRKNYYQQTDGQNIDATVFAYNF